MSTKVAIIGFGEAGQAFAGSSAWTPPTCAYDRLTDQLATREAKLADYARRGVDPANSLREALEGADLVLSLVTADQALSVAMAATNLRTSVIYCDMNSVAPGTKQAAASAVESRGADYVDVAIMAPVNPRQLSVPLLLSGPAAAQAEHALRSAGFSNCRVIGGRVGQASAIKMIRSIMVKGIEALTAEAMLAAAAAGVTEEVLASLDESDTSLPWSSRADYNLERIMVHGLRRAEEMEEAARTLEWLGVEPEMTRGSVNRQRAIGRLGLRPRAGLDAKLAQLRPATADAA